MALTYGEPEYCIVPHQNYRPKNWREEKNRVEKLEKVLKEKGIDKRYKTKKEAEKILKENIKNHKDYYAQERTPVYGLKMFV